MRAYFAIIKDSFREATASWVLWVLLGVITLVLVLIAPLGVRAKLTTDFGGGEIRDPQALIAQLRTEADKPGKTPAKRIWSLWDESRREKLIEFQQFRPETARSGRRGGGFGDFLAGRETLFKGLRELVDRSDFYEPGVWKEESLPKEARDYIAKRSELTAEERARLNRLLIEAAAPSQFTRREAQSIAVSYFWMENSESLPFTKTQAHSFIKEVIVPTLMSFLVGVVGVFVAILVTSPVIPQMFEPGSINLLLSKPVQRSAVYLAKFFGGCAFILLNVGYLCLGLWLILGLRFGIWNRGMLLCIPIFLFLFTIYYSVSTFTGVIWKSAVVSVVLCICLWLACFLVGAIKVNVMERFVVDPERIVRVVDAGGTLIAIIENGRINRWNPETNKWEQLRPPPVGGDIKVTLGPIYHAPSDQILMGEGWRVPFGMGASRVNFQIARGSEGWQLKEAQPLPGETAAILVESQGSVLAIAREGIFRLVGDPAPATNQVKFLGMPLPFGNRTEFKKVMADESLVFSEPLAGAIDPASGSVAVYSRGSVLLFTKDAKGKFVQSATSKLDGDEGQGAKIAFGGSSVVIARSDGLALFLSATDLAVRATTPLEPASQPRFIATSPDGERIGILFQNRRFWLLDSSAATAKRARVRGQGDISAFAFHDEQLLIADRVNRVTDYSVSDLKRGAAYAPAMTTSLIVYYYLVTPIYTVFPKPGELDNTVHYLLTEKETTDLGIFREDLEQARENLHPWRPVWSSAIFVAVMLGLACLYIERHQF